MATYLFFKGKSLQVTRYGPSGGRLRYIASRWVQGKPKRRVIIRTDSETITIRGSATRKEE